MTLGRAPESVWVLVSVPSVAKELKAEADNNHQGDCGPARRACKRAPNLVRAALQRPRRTFQMQIRIFEKCRQPPPPVRGPSCSDVLLQRGKMKNRVRNLK